MNFHEQPVGPDSHRRARKAAVLCGACLYRGSGPQESAMAALLYSGTTARSKVFLEKSENVRTPRSHSITL